MEKRTLAAIVLLNRISNARVWLVSLVALTSASLIVPSGHALPDNRMVRGWFPSPATDSRYAFPMESSPGVLWWTPNHWDGGNAVDIRFDHSFDRDPGARLRFYDSGILAVTSGVALRADNPRGGTAIMLIGDDGRTYYYAHLSAAVFDGRRRVERGEVLGTIGRSGTWTQYLETHLHLSIVSGSKVDLDWTADISASRWLERAFSRQPRRFEVQEYQPDQPNGLPVFGRAQIIETFAASRARNPLLAGVTIGRQGDNEVMLRAPLTGVVTVHRDTVVGTRIQISNEHSGWSVIVSGDVTPWVDNGTLVYAESVLGRVSGSLHYMSFERGVPVSPPGI